jgi:hypothetical protein
MLIDGLLRRSYPSYVNVVFLTGRDLLVLVLDLRVDGSRTCSTQILVAGWLYI